MGMTPKDEVTADRGDYASPVELRYAKVLSVGVRTAFILLLISFAIYVARILTPLVPLQQLPKYWGLSAAQYARATGTPTGWAWLKLIAKGDILNLVGVVMLTATSIVSNLAVLPIFARQGEKAHLVISALLILVLVVSASNLLVFS